jgi:Trp operon repressor
LSGPRSLGEVVDMVMYKQGSGLVAGGTIGPQSTGGIMSPQKKPQFNLQSFAGTQPTPQGQSPATTSGIPWMPTDFWGQVGYRTANLFTGGQYGIDRAREYAAQQQAPKAPPMPSAPLMAAPKTASRQLSQEEVRALSEAFKKSTGRDFATSEEGASWTKPIEYYLNLYNQYVPRVTQAQVAQAPTQARAEAAAAQPFIGPGFTMPTRSAFEDLVNPYDEIYKGGLMSAAGGRVARQFAPGRERLQQDLAARGISPDSPLFMSMMAQGADREDAARGAAIEQAMLEGAGKQAEFNRFKATGIADYTRAGAELALRQERQPAELRSLAADATVREAEASIAADPATINAKKREIQAKLGMTEAELEAALNFLETTDPNKWWNHPGWRAGGAFVDSVSKVARAIKDIKG